MKPINRFKRFFTSKLGRRILIAIASFYTIPSLLFMLYFFLNLKTAGNFQLIVAYLCLPAFFFLFSFLSRVMTGTFFGSVETYNQKLTRLTGSLTQASMEVDLILKELSRISIERAYAVQSLEQELLKLAEREEQTKRRIQDLENMPLAVAEHFAKLTEPSEKKGARRDYMLFIAGLIAGQLLQIVLKLFGY